MTGATLTNPTEEPKMNKSATATETATKPESDRPFRQSSTGRRSLPIGMYEADDAALEKIVKHMTRPGVQPTAKADAARAAIHFYAKAIDDGTAGGGA